LHSRRPELIERLEAGGRVWLRASPGGNSTSSYRQTVSKASSNSFGLMPASRKLRHDWVAGGFRRDQKIPPRLLAEQRVRRLIEFGETGRYAGFNGAFAQEASAKGVDGARKKAFEIRQALLNPCERGRQRPDPRRFVRVLSPARAESGRAVPPQPFA
jgi:hypothetical protein